MRRGRPGTSLRQVLWTWPAAVALAWAVAELLTRGPDPLPLRPYLLVLAGGAALSAHALAPAASESLLSRLLVPPAWGAAVMGGALLLRAASLPWATVWPTALRLVGGVGVLALLLAGVTETGAASLGGRGRARRAVWALLGLAGAAPVWLGPAAERLAIWPRFVNSVVAASPLTYFGVLADVDYLRTTWFYENCALGALRYDYPSAFPITVGYLAVGVSLSVAAGLQNRRKPKLQEVGQ